MKLGYIWERYFLKEFLKIFFLFLFCFYGLYILIDYASHTSALPHHHTQIDIKELARYYLYIFASRAEILIPFGLIIALIKTVLSLNTHQELVALLASGINLKTLMRPFIGVALFCVALLFLNEQFLLPSALKKLRHIEDASKHKKKHQKLDIAVNHVILADGSLLLFQSYDSTKEQFFDSYWIRSTDDIYRIKYLSPYAIVPKGDFIDHLQRQANGELASVEAFDKRDLPDLHFNQKALESTLMDPEAISLTGLWKELPLQIDLKTEKDSKILTSFYWKIMIPWLCLLVIIATAPFCVKFSRQPPILLIYIGGIFGLVAFYLFMDASLVVAKRQVVEPFWAIGVPFLTVFGIFGWRYFKM